MSDLFQNHAAKSGPVECLGQTFPSDEARREHYLKLLAEKLKDPAFRKIEGFPIGSDEDILALSDPPYYTACPNPFIEDFVRHYGKPYDSSVPYSKEPFAADVSEGQQPIIRRRPRFGRQLQRRFDDRAGQTGAVRRKNDDRGRRDLR